MRERLAKALGAVRDAVARVAAPVVAEWAPDGLQVAGIVCVVVGAFVLAPWLGWVVLGGGLILAGRALSAEEGEPPGEVGYLGGGED